MDRTLLSKVVRLVDDESINVLRIVPLGTEEREQVLPVGNKDFKRISHAVHAAALTGTIMPAKPEKVRRPPNSFILYRQYHHKSIKAANPGTSNNDICESFCSRLSFSIIFLSRILMSPI